MTCRRSMKTGANTMDINNLMRDLEGDFERVQDIDPSEIENDDVREFIKELQNFGEDHGFDGERREYGVTFYAEFTVYEEAQTPTEAQRRAMDKYSKDLTRDIADRGFGPVAENIECIDVEKM